MSEGDLKSRLMAAIPELTEQDFGYHATDLYVRCYPVVLQWLYRNYEFYKQISTFVGAKGSDWEGKLAIEIPFAGRDPVWIELRTKEVWGEGG
jgi:hypothetical protein